MPSKVRTSPGGDDASRNLSLALNKWLQDHGANDILVTCGNCKHMAEAGPAFCNLYQMTPPVVVILQGCPSHEDVSDIPF